MTYYSGADLARTFRVVRKNTLQIANEIPESQYAFRATPETRSVSEVLAHIAASVRWTYRVHAFERPSRMTAEDFARYGQENAAYEKTLKTKADIVNALETNRDEFATFLEKASDAFLTETVSFPAGSEPPQKTRFEMLLNAKEHEMHHRGQLMVLQRMVGLVPHLTKEREARMAARRAPTVDQASAQKQGA